MDPQLSEAATGPLTYRLLDGRYEVGRLLARGGMATVYEAVDTRLTRPVAIKVMHPAFAADPDFVARFIREARSAARLSHANVVAVYDQGSDGDIVFLAMEYVPGGTLRDLLRHRGRLTPAEALPIYEHLLSALAAAHRAGLVHRDVKPENVLISDDGRVKVADFGLARAVATSVSNAATTGVIIGTVSYLSPEQVERSVADARSDVYSAGIVLYEMLTGEKPYRGETPMEVAFQHVHNRVPPPSRLVPGLPAALDTVVTRATARDPDLRPRDAAELLEEVIRAREGRPLLLPPLPTDAEPTVRRDDVQHTLVVGGPSVGAPLVADPSKPAAPAVPSRWRTGGVPVATGSTVAGRAPTGGREESSDGSVLPPDARKRRRRGWILFLIVLILGACAGFGAYWYAEGRFTTTPAVLQLPTKEAIAKIEGLGLAATVAADGAFSETIPIDHVVSTDPESGARILSGAQVLLVVSKGPERFTLPDVAGSTPAAAVEKLESDAMPLEVASTHKEEYSDTVAAGTVTRTEPPEGTPVKRGQSIALVLSLGRQPVDVPLVEGLPQAEAEKKLTDAGFTPVEDPAQFHDSITAGVVISQSVKDTQGLRGDEIHLVVSKGPDLVEVPDVTDRSQGEAQEILEEAGFTVDFDYPLGAAFIDRVVGQSSEAGTSEPRGSTITLQIV